jgi:peptide deformylase
MIYPIVKFGAPVLEQPAETITEFDTPELNQLIADMFESMYAAHGVGLAAPQIGIGKRIPKSSSWKARFRSRKAA